MNTGVLWQLLVLSAWHEAQLHATACCFASDLLACADGRKGLTHMRLDGEPWAQPIPAKGAPEGPLKVMLVLLLS